MSKKRKLSRFPATIIGLLLGLLVGGAAAIKEMYQQQHPTIGIVIIVTTPIITFIFEEVMRIAFPEAYLERVAGQIFALIRIITNESFRLRFNYTLRFPLPAGVESSAVTVDDLCTAINATPGGDPIPTSIGTNFLHLRFSNVPFSIVLRWAVEMYGEDVGDVTSSETVFVVTMEPEIRDFVMRNAQTDVEALLMRLNELQQKLIIYFSGIQPNTLATADAWLGINQPPDTSVPTKRKDKVTGAEYRLYPGRLHISGESPATLGAICRYVRILEPPPDENS
jgi:hypothetical protein